MARASLTARRMAVAILLAATGAAAGEAQDLSTPRRAMRAYVDACRAGDFAAAAAVLELRGMAPAAEGPRLARELQFVLDQQLWLDWDAISDEPGGSAADGAGGERVGELQGRGKMVPLRLVREADGAWRIGRATVAAIPALYEEHGPGWLGDHLPLFLLGRRVLELQAWQWLGAAIALALAILAAMVLGTLASSLALRLARRTRGEWDDRLVAALSGPGRLLLGLASLALSLPHLRLAVPAERVAGHLLRSLAVVALTWTALRGVGLAGDLARERLAARVGGREGAATRLAILRRVAGVTVLVVGGALVLLQFDAFRTLGTSLLASAGVAGIVVGLAAQRSIGTLLAGLQISLAQPLRIGDVVVMEGEWGTIEEITLTYVVLKAWDLRRVVIPIGRVLDASFQNWTRGGTDLLGTVTVHADYGVPVEAVRAEVERYTRTRAEWDGKVAALQVTGATERTVELRALVSAADASRAWDLRCALRERLVSYLQDL